MNSKQLPAVTDETLDELRNRYAEPAIPKCSICGGELSVQRTGGGGPTIWACSGMIDDPTRERNWIYADGRSFADEHYERSSWTDYRRGGDSDVINLIEAYRMLHGFDHIPNTGKMTGWFKCSDEMPKKSGQFLCRVNDESEPEFTVLVFEYLSAHKKFNSGGLNITHWMPLPALPED